MIANDGVPHVIRAQIPVNGGPDGTRRVAIAGDDHKCPGADDLQGLAQAIEVAFPSRGWSHEVSHVARRDEREGDRRRLALVSYRRHLSACWRGGLAAGQDGKYNGNGDRSEEHTSELQSLRH